MGEAKRRGTRDQRVAAAIEDIQTRQAEAERAAADEEARIEQQHLERWNQLSPEQKQRRLNVAAAEVAILSSGMLSGLAGLRAGLGMVTGRRYPHTEYLTDTCIAVNGEGRP